ncbi:MAG: cell division protein FtsL [Pseudomonadota bacterium]|uniref:cell division protein FtsL n=1 Tax=Roseovarius TaxID=74030 RepID=UPI0022A86DC0|nr:cell division protein FtsL [Roseovarius sp. EGI FJ00037]MCZ0811981.1 cell division protein FtsL [Roseovarius sp. EGI FJ00037]
MRSLFYVLTALAVIGLAFWAYRENYRTQAALTKAGQLQHEIARNRQRLRVLNAEWAYLNRPERLMELAELNFDKLGLLPLQPYQFGRIDQVAYPPEDDLLPILNPIDVSGMEAEQP